MTDDVYARQGFGGRLGLGARPALVVIDFTEAFVDPAQFGGGNIAAAVAATRPVLDAFRKRGLPVVFTRIAYAEDGSDAGLWTEKLPGLRTLTHAAAGSRVVADLAPLPGERVLTKTQASAFFGTDLAAWLIHRRVDSLVVTGCTTSGCVRASVVDAMSWGFRPIVLEDAVGDRAPGPHDANLFDMRQKYADVVPSGELLATLSGAAVR